MSDGDTTPASTTASTSTDSLTQRLLRAQTKFFIDLNPVNIELIPREHVKQPDGGSILVDSDPLPNQTFRLIPQVDGQEPVKNEVGEVRSYPFVLLGEWASDMPIGSYWVDDLTGSRYVIEHLHHYNGYQRKAGVDYYGSQSRTYEN